MMDPLTVDQYDVNEQQHRFDKENLVVTAERDKYVAKMKMKESRVELYQVIGGGFLFVSLILGIITIVVFHPKGPVRPDDEFNRETACYSNGGGWVPKDLLMSGNSTSDHGLCVFPGKKVSQ
jgi:hypothetical protein